MAHLIRYYNKRNDELAGEIPLTGISIVEIQEAFCLPNDNPAYDCYLITPENIGLIEGRNADLVDFKRYDYFVEYE